MLTAHPKIGDLTGLVEDVNDSKHRLGLIAPCIDAGFDEVLEKPLQRWSSADVPALAAQRNAGTDGQDFNPETWQEMLAVFGYGGTVRIAEALAEDLSVQMQRHDAAVVAGDLPALKRMAHALRGASLQLGAEALADLYEATEAACTAKDQPAALSLSANAMARYCALIEHLVRQAGPAVPDQAAI